jgi:altronate dehydratase
MARKTPVSCVHIGTLCRTINALSGIANPYDPKQNDKDVSLLHDILHETAETLASIGAKIKDINKELHDAGWDDTKVTINRDKNSTDLLTWKYE